MTTAWTEPIKPSERWLTVDEVSELLQVRRETLYRWIADGRLGGGGHKVGKQWRFKQSDIGDWVRNDRASAHYGGAKS